MNRKSKILKKNLIAFLTIFDGKPNMLAEYLMEYDIITEKIANMLINNKELSKKSKELKDNGEIEKPYFSNIEEMKEFYNSFFKTERVFDPINNPSQASLLEEIKKAITNEDYEMASKIRDYCKINNINIKKFL